MPPAFFVCYRREDAGYAAALSGALAQRHGPDRVFKDITSLRPADHWRAEVAAAIGSATHVLALVGPNWMAGVDPRGMRNGRPDPVAFELAEALRAGRVIVPVLVGGARMPPAHHLPYALAGLPDLNAAYIRTESADTDIATLVNRLPQPERRQHDLPSWTQPPGPPPRPHRQGRPRRPLGPVIALAAAAVIVIAVAAAFLPTIVRSFGPGTDPAGQTGGPVGSEPRGQSEPTLRVTPGHGRPGTKVTATAAGFAPGAKVQFTFNGFPEPSVVADGAGNATLTFPVPTTVPSGNWWVTASSGAFGTQESFTVDP